MSSAQPDASAPECADGTLAHDGYCYWLNTTPLSNADALSACNAIGAGWGLVEVTSPELNTFVSNLTSAHELWLGGVRTDTGWVWPSNQAIFFDGTTVNGSVHADAYANWTRGSQPSGGVEESCMRMVLDANRTWGDQGCSGLLASVCSGPPS